MKKLLFLFMIVMQLSSILHAQFVYLDQSRFKLNGQNYYPMALNYGVTIRKNSIDEYWITPIHSYGNSNEFECQNREDCLDEIKAQLQMIKDMGFNSVRIVGLVPEYNFDYATNKSGIIYMNSVLLDEGDSVYYSQNVQEELTSSVKTRMFSFISDVLNEAEDRDLKVILLCGGPDSAIYRDNYADYLEDLAEEFKNNTTLLAYDLFNEPGWFSKMKNENLSKGEICCIVNEWIERMKAKDANHLITIGFKTPLFVEYWDPEFISVDFASFHPYNNEMGDKTEVENFLYWYSKNMTKPWMIGETGLPADTSNYEEQRQFANITSRRCIDCGGDGFSWWQYQDVWWGSWLQDHYGLLSHEGLTQTTVSGLSVQGTAKPSVIEFQTFSLYNPTYNCPKYSNYYNMLSSHKTKVSGKIVNSINNLPIEGVVVIGQDTAYNTISSTFTKVDGSFELYSESENPIRQLYYGYLRMDNGAYSLSAIDNSLPIFLNNIILNIGQSQTYNSQNSITVSNFNIKGDGTYGGTAIINAPLYIKFNSGTKVEKGGRLNASSNRVLETSLTLTPLDDCIHPLKSENVDQSLALSVLGENMQGTHIFPNPTDGIINIKFKNSEYRTIELIDIYGKKIFHESTSEQFVNLDISMFPSGIYLLKTNSKNVLEFSKIILK
jgi:hypothetical protein